MGRHRKPVMDNEGLRRIAVALIGQAICDQWHRRQEIKRDAQAFLANPVAREICDGLGLELDALLASARPSQHTRISHAISPHGRWED